MSDIEKARDGIFQRLLVAQGPMSRSAVKSVMRDIDEFNKLKLEKLQYEFDRLLESVIQAADNGFKSMAANRVLLNAILFHRPDYSNAPYGGVTVHQPDCAVAVNGRHECSCKDQPIAHWSASTWGHHHCSCGCFAYTTEGGDGESLESCRKEDE